MNQTTSDALLGRVHTFINKLATTHPDASVVADLRRMAKGYLHFRNQLRQELIVVRRDAALLHEQKLAVVAAMVDVRAAADRITFP